MRVIGDLDKYVRFQTAEAIPVAAAQSGGIAGVGAGAAAGLAIGQSMMGAGGAAAPAEDPYEMIQKLHGLLTVGAITQEEFDAKKTALLAKIG